ncbi:MAG: hypothetical protein WCA11_13500 [Terracidiphilus sp.]
MNLDPKQFVRAATASALAAFFAFPQTSVAEVSDHIVSPADLQKATVDASRTRQKNLEALDKFFSSEKAQTALKSAHMNSDQVKTAVAGLSDQELAQLAARANHAQSDFAAGNIDDRDLLIILVALAALILIIVAVH